MIIQTDQIRKVLYNGKECQKIKLNGGLIWRNNAITPDKKLYPFGVLSDVHIHPSSDAAHSTEDFTNAVKFYDEQGCKLLCITGDLTQNGTDEEFAEYTEIRDANRGDVRVFETTGNHEASSARTYKSDISAADCIAYHFPRLVGSHFCYFIENGKYTYWDIDSEHYTTDTARNATIIDESLDLPDSDIFLFIGILGDKNNGIFWEGLMQWIYNVLESHKDKRVFVFEHCRAERAAGYSGGNMTEDLFAQYVSGNPTGAYKKPLWGQADNGGNVGLLFRTIESLFAHYTNCIWFHGHTHMAAETELQVNVPNRDIANVDKYFGDAYDAKNIGASVNNTKWTWSVHVPSCAYPRVATENGQSIEEIDGRSQGAIVDVYQNKVVVRYIDFAQLQADGTILYGNKIINGIEHHLATSPDSIGPYTPPVVGGQTLVQV